MSNVSNTQADAAPTEVRVLDPVAKSDLEKGLKAPGEGSPVTDPAEHAQGKMVLGSGCKPRNQSERHKERE